MNSNRHAKWVVVGLLWLVATLNYADRMSIFSVFPLLKKEMGVSDIVLALLGSTFLWVYGASSPLGGYIGDRFNLFLAIGVMSLARRCLAGDMLKLGAGAADENVDGLAAAACEP